MALVKYNVREVSNFVSDIMEKVAALKVLAVVKKQSLVDLKELYDENLLDEMKYNELIEEINTDFEKKKVDLMESVVPKTSPIAHTVDNVIANTPVSALNTSVTLMDEDVDNLSAIVKPNKNDGTIGGFFNTISICAKSRPETVRRDHVCRHCSKAFETKAGKLSHEKTCKSKDLRSLITKNVASKFFGQEVDVRLVSMSNPLPEVAPKDDGVVVRIVMDAMLNKVEQKIREEIKQKTTKPRRKAVGEGNKVTTGALHRMRYTLQFKAEVIRSYDNLKCQSISSKVSEYLLNRTYTQ